MYLADRESISRSGFPIQDESRVSMKHGPVNSTTYSFINGEYDPTNCGWADFLSDRSKHRVGLTNPNLSEDDLDELSDADIRVLDEVWGKFGQMNEWELRDWTHKPENLPEWEDPGSSSFEIPLERMMHSLAIKEANAQADIVKSLGYAKQLVNDL